MGFDKIVVILTQPLDYLKEPDPVFEELNNDDNPKVFVLWGKEAQKLKEYITNEKHLIIESNHPSPLSASRGFFGSKPFSKINNFLISNKTIAFLARV